MMPLNLSVQQPVCRLCTIVINYTIELHTYPGLWAPLWLHELAVWQSFPEMSSRGRRGPGPEPGTLGRTSSRGSLSSSEATHNYHPVSSTAGHGKEVNNGVWRTIEKAFRLTERQSQNSFDLPVWQVRRMDCDYGHRVTFKKGRGVSATLPLLAWRDRHYKVPQTSGLAMSTRQSSHIERVDGPGGQQRHSLKARGQINRITFSYASFTPTHLVVRLCPIMD